MSTELTFGLSLIFDVVLIICIVILALGTLFNRSVFTSIVLFISLGLMITIAWVRLGAIDVAIAEAAIGAGLTGALLLGAWKRFEKKKSQLLSGANDD